jgi:hypothetical protein
MRIAIDFDGTLVDDTRPYNDVSSPLKLLPGARKALESFKRAGHTIVVNSARANRSLREDWTLNPLWREKIEPFNYDRWMANRELNEARYQQMREFCSDQLTGLVDVVDDGMQGKVSADVFIDDRAQNMRLGWTKLAELYGER